MWHLQKVILKNIYFHISFESKEISQDSLWVGRVLMMGWTPDVWLQALLTVLSVQQKRFSPDEPVSPAGAFPWFPTGHWV